MHFNLWLKIVAETKALFTPVCEVFAENNSAPAVVENECAFILEKKKHKQRERINYL